MAVGKARTRAENSDGEAFHFVVPCYADIDENVIKDHLKRDQFFWLDLTAPNQEKLTKLGELFVFTRWRWRTRRNGTSARSSTTTATTSCSCSTAPKPTRRTDAAAEVHLFIYRSLHDHRPS